MVVHVGAAAVGQDAGGPGAAAGAGVVVHVTAGDHPETKPIYDIDSLHALRIARIMRDEGTYLSGRPLTSPPTFLIGAVENPFSPPADYRPLRLVKKIDAGAEFIQTQICFNLERMREFMPTLDQWAYIKDTEYWFPRHNLGRTTLPQRAARRFTFHTP